MNITIIDVLQWAVYFLSLYFSVFWVLVYLEEEPKRKKRTLKEYPTVAIAVPVYNEEKTVEKTIQSILKIDYPTDKLQVVIVNDGSTDKTREIAQKYTKHEHVRLINQKNGGKASALNTALKETDTEYFVCLDADSEVAPDALKILLRDFSSKDVGAVQPAMKIKNDKKLNLLEKLQWYEYLVNVLFKKIMGKIDCIHVIPGPFGVYSRAAIDEVGPFRVGDLTEDLEMTLRLQSHNFVIVQNTQAEVYTNAMPTIKRYLAQRNRWFKGGVFSAIRYRYMMFNKNWGDFGIMQLPILIASGVISLILVGSLLYSWMKPVVENAIRMNLVSFDLLTYLRSIELDILFIDISAQSILLIVIMLGLSLTFLRLATYYTRERILQYGPFIAAAYLFLYFFLLAATWVVVLKDLVFRKVQKW